MTANYRRSTEPLSPHLLLSMALGQSSAPDADGPIASLLWRVRREVFGSSRQRSFPGQDSGPQDLPMYEASPRLTVADVMTQDLVSVSAATPVSEIAGALASKRISAVPVVNTDGALVGIVSESDLMRRAEIGTQRRRSWWRKLLADMEAVAAVNTPGIRSIQDQMILRRRSNS